MKSEPMFRVTRDHSTKKEFEIRSSTWKVLESYAKFLESLDEEEPSPGEILDIIVPSTLRKDKAFLNWEKAQDPH